MLQSLMSVVSQDTSEKLTSWPTLPLHSLCLESKAWGLILFNQLLLVFAECLLFTLFSLSFAVVTYCHVQPSLSLSFSLLCFSAVKTWIFVEFSLEQNKALSWLNNKRINITLSCFLFQHAELGVKPWRQSAHYYVHCKWVVFSHAEKGGEKKLKAHNCHIHFNPDTFHLLI